MGRISDVWKQTASLQKLTLDGISIVHRINQRYCTLLFLLFGVFLVSQKKIYCICPSQFDTKCKDSKESRDYINEHCWTFNTYIVHFDEPFPETIAQRKNKEITYYQWVPVIFFFMAFMCLLPYLFWKIGSAQSDLYLKKMLKNADDVVFKSSDEIDKAVESFAQTYCRWIDNKERLAKQNPLLATILFPVRTSYLTIVLIISDILYLTTTISQFCILDLLLGIDFKHLGTDFLSSFKSFVQWEDHVRFPRVTFCDLPLRQLSNVQIHTSQCLLRLNMFNEKIFLMIWFVLVVMMTVNALNLLYHIKSLYFAKEKLKDQIHYFLKEKQRANPTATFKHKSVQSQQKLVENFIRDCFYVDGRFLLWTLKGTHGTFVNAFIENLWKSYFDKKQQND